LHNKKLKQADKHTESSNCDCKRISSEDIILAVDEVVSFTGKEPEKVILILQEVQKRLNYLPSEALRHICEVTEIPGSISGVSTFYSQFRHLLPEDTLCLLRYRLSRKRPPDLRCFKRVPKIDEQEFRPITFFL
jgi:hypothetical protein